jgi:hypothetical protein
LCFVTGPSFADNEQIVLVGKEGRIHVTESISNGNLWYKGNEIFEKTRRDDPVEIARLIGVRKREFDVPFATVREWRRGLLNGVGLALRPKILKRQLSRRLRRLSWTERYMKSGTTHNRESCIMNSIGARSRIAFIQENRLSFVG